MLFNNMFHTNYNFEYFECILNLIKLLLINFLNYQYYVIGNIVTEKPCWKGVSIKYIMTSFAQEKNSHQGCVK